ncbi:hypothetical protein SANA_25530 [Gottschalkiaceae bacterium SANA]|nr:hypothetical protein SANA_25530 [Gottschalkiaceae bacterium SANA]
MKVWAILAIVYAVIVVILAVLKPEAVWKIKKIQWFEKVLGEKGTEIFFYIWALLFLVLGVWLLTK